MLTDSKDGEEKDNVDKETKSYPGRFVLVLVLCAVWVSVFSTIYFAQPIWTALTFSAAYMATALNIELGVFLLGAFASFYLSAIIVFAVNPSTRARFRSLMRNIFRGERSFYSNSSENDDRYKSISVGYGDAKYSSISKLVSRLDRVEQGYLRTANNQFDESKWEDAQSRAAEIAIEKLTEGAINSVRTSLAQTRVLELEQKSLSRLSDQIVALGYRANISLGAGVGFCVVGLLILWSTLSSVELENTAATSPVVYWAEFIKIYAPRLSIVLIIEIIGFFFLKLFRTALDEIRITQNEATNVEMKLIASNLASSGCESELPEVIRALLSTERNVVIEKGQTTVDLEKAKAWRASDADLIEKLQSLLNLRSR